MKRVLPLFVFVALAAARRRAPPVCKNNRGSCADSDGDGVPDARDPRPHDSAVDGVPDHEHVQVPRVLKPLWPPTPRKLPGWAALFALAWAFVLASLGTRADDGDRQYEAPRARPGVQVAQVMQQSDKTDEKRRKASRRRAHPRAAASGTRSPRPARQRAARPDLPGAAAEAASRRSSCAEAQRGAPAARARDEIEDVPVRDGAARAEARRRDARAAARLLRARARAAARARRRGARRGGRQDGGRGRGARDGMRRTRRAGCEAIGVAERVRDRFTTVARAGYSAAAGARPGRGRSRRPRSCASW